MHEADVFHAIADPTRRAVLEMLRRGDRSVTEMIEPFRISQPAVSQHLRVLREAGLVRVRNAGRERRYALDPRPLRAVDRWLRRLVIDPAGHVIRIQKED